MSGGRLQPPISQPRVHTRPELRLRGHAELSARYDLSNLEVDDRARNAWPNANWEPL
jgi:hypothetical protein